MPRSLAAQMLRATSLGGADKVNYDLIAKAVAAWEIKRGIGVICPIGKGSAEWMAVRTAARARLAAQFEAGDIAPDTVVETPAQARERKLARKRDYHQEYIKRRDGYRRDSDEYAKRVMESPGDFPRSTVSRVRLEYARRHGGEEAVARVQAELRAEAEADARYNAKHKRRANLPKQATKTTNTTK